jgi:hypothetical protein
MKAKSLKLKAKSKFEVGQTFDLLSAFNFKL